MPGGFADSVRRFTVEDRSRRRRRLLMQVPVSVAGGLGAALMLVRCAVVLHENLQSNPDGWRGVLVLAAILGAASVIVVFACAAAGAVIGGLLQGLFAGRLAEHGRARPEAVRHASAMRH